MLFVSRSIEPDFHRSGRYRRGAQSSRRLAKTMPVAREYCETGTIDTAVRAILGICSASVFDLLRWRQSMKNVGFPEVTSKEQFSAFINDLRQDLIAHPEYWQNDNLHDFLESLSAWIEDREEDAPPDAWKLLAQSLFAGSRYE